MASPGSAETGVPPAGPSGSASGDDVPAATAVPAREGEEGPGNASAASPDGFEGSANEASPTDAPAEGNQETPSDPSAAAVISCNAVSVARWVTLPCQEPCLGGLWNGASQLGLVAYRRLWL